MTERDLQDQFFEALSGRFRSKGEMVDTLIHVFGFSKDSAYRRIRGQTILAPFEMARIARHYNLSLDRLVFGHTNRVMFNFNAFNRVVTSFDDYFDGILGHLQAVRRIPEVNIYYSSLEIPIFYYCFHPELIGFKLYVWGRAIWDLPFTRDLPFSLDLIPPSARAKSAEMLEFYLQLPSVELWSLNIFDNTLNQIEYHLNAGIFKDPADALHLVDRMTDLSKHMQVMAEAGQKRHFGSREDISRMELYHNEMIYTNNTILVDSPSMNGVFTTFGNPNFLFSDDERIVAYTKDWFRRVISKSHPLSLGSEKVRHRFFHQLLERVERSRKRIEALA